MRVAIVCALIAGCGTQSSSSFLLETTDCALVNNFTVGGAATAWSDCRVYWTGAPNNILTVELTTPGSTGSFVAPAPGWARASVHVPAGNLGASLTPTAFPAAAGLPSTVAADKIALDLTVPTCATFGSAMTAVDTMADVGTDSVSFSISLSGTCMASPAMYSGGFILTAAAQDGGMTDADPATPVTTP